MSLRDPPGEAVISAMEKMQNSFILDEGMNARQFLEKRIEDKSSSGDQEPFFVANLNDVAQKHWGFLKELPRVKPFYAVKCNSSMGVVQTLASLGTGFSCVSKEEIDMVLGIGVSADDIVYSNPYKQLSHIRHAAKLGIRKMTFDCESELEKITGSHLETQMILRIKSNNTTQLSRKVGTPLEECRHLLEYAKDHKIQVIGVSFYVGYRCNPHDFTQSIEDASLIYKMGIQIGHAMKLLDIGGGFPGASESIHMFPEFAEAVNSALIKHFPEGSEVEVIAEPGKYYVESAFSSAVNIICKKVVDPEGPMGRTCKKIIYYVNDGTFGSHKNNMLRRIPVRPCPIKYVDPTQPRYPSSLWGPSCAPNDKILNEENLPEMNVGEWIMFQDMGAYSISMSTEFNGFPHLSVYYVLSRELQQVLEKNNGKR